MAYTEKYFLSFCNPIGDNCRVSVMQDNFIGTPIELIGQAEPIIISWDNSDDFKFKPIIESEASIQLWFDDAVLSMSELWTSNERTFKVEYTIEGVLEWTGFIIPEGFDYNLKGGKYEAVLIASDGLSTLEGILFKTDSNQFYGVQDLGYNNGAEFPFILILTEILRKLDLGIDIWTLVDYYEQTMTLLNSDSRDSDPLSISYANVKTYVNDTDREDIAYFEDVNEAWDCKKIIENICNIWGARIYQESGVWKFKSIHADSSIANPYNTENDPFVGENPIQEDVYFWKYEAYFSTNTDINFDVTAFFYSNFETLSLNDFLYNGDLDPIPVGFYLVKGLNKILQVNPSGKIIGIRTYEPAVSNYYWKKYNNTAGYLGRELVKTEVVIPCSNKDIFLKDNDATVRMDKVYKQFRVNFDYTFIRFGDTQVNLLINGNFAENFEQYGQLEAPPGWERFRTESQFRYPRGRVIELDSTQEVITNGNKWALEMGVQYGDTTPSNTVGNSSTRGAYAQFGLDFSQKVTSINFNGWVKYKYAYENGKNFGYPVFKAILYPNDTGSDPNEGVFYVLENIISEDYDLGWRKITYAKTKELFVFIWRVSQPDRHFFILYPTMGNKWVESEKFDFKWYDFNLKVQPVPVEGKVDFFVHGICTNIGPSTDSFPKFSVKVPDGKTTKDKKMPIINTTINRFPVYTGLEFSYIPNPDEEVPKTDYIYANGDVNYTFQEDPIRIYNGDTIDPEIISGIVVPTNLSGLKNKWDTFNNAFGKTDIGMILCKSVMQQYYKPNRLLDCDFKADNFKYGDIIYFEHIPGIKFIMLRGSFNSKRGYWEGCTLAEIGNENIAPGGVVNGDSLLPQWQETGNTRCVKDEDGLNTGISEYETQDVNSNSDSFGDFRWNQSGEDLVSCPIGQPSKYFWGTDYDTYDIANFKDYTIDYEDESIGQVQVSYENTGGEYIYFLHLSSLGSVVQVGNSYQNQIISSFTYLADITINGYLYRVLRQDFVTSEFENLLLTFYIQ